MLRVSSVQRGFRAVFLQGTGLYDEDHYNDYKSRMLLNPQYKRRWYGNLERRTTMKLLTTTQIMATEYQHEGKDTNGYGAFERELERKGIPVDKYPLPSTVAVTRAREMTVLRRQALESKSSELMAAQQAKQRRGTPSAWYDEAAGPLNPHYLQFVRSQYTDIDVTDLPDEPIRR